MKPGSLRYLIDGCLYAVFGAVAVVGLLLAYVVPAGPDQPKQFLGVYRHGWISIHLSLAVVFLGLLFLHLLLNWKWIVGVSKRILGPRWGPRLWAVALAWLPVLVLAWLLAYC